MSRFVTSRLSTVPSYQVSVPSYPVSVPSYPVSAELEAICLHNTDLIVLLQQFDHSLLWILSPMY